MKYCEAKAASDTDPPAIRTAKVLQEITNTIEECIQLTFDTPEMNNNGKLPVLDLEVWVSDNQVRHSFYKKEVSNEFTPLYKSAVSESMKLNTVFMEAYWRIVNCSPGTPWEEVSSQFTGFANTMRISGYNHIQRYNAIKGAITRYRDMESEIKTGVRKYFYRSGKQIREAKAKKKDWANTWFLKGDIKNTRSCPVTPRGVLKK